MFFQSDLAFKAKEAYYVVVCLFSLTVVSLRFIQQ